MTSKMTPSTIEDLLSAIRMLKSRGGSAAIVRFTSTDDILLAAESEKGVSDWNRKMSGKKALFVSEIPPVERLVSFAEQELKATEGNLMVKRKGLVSWGRTTADVTALAAGKIPGKTMDEGPFSQRVVLITGAGRGVGAGLAGCFFHDGANVVIADVDEKTGKEKAAALNRNSAGNEAIFVHGDVSNPLSVAEMVKKILHRYGGIDVVVSNAGVLKAGSLEEMTPEDFDFVNNVNYRGFFLLAKYVSAVMKRQYLFDPSRLADIIQINSKSGLQGSNRNFAYAGSKFGSIGLVQSFAKELVGYGIKVNAVCPGNFFDLPLWSDPDNGLFVQYLRTGKVPGAKTVEEVRKYYENLVPMKRGCTIEDLYRAVRYIIEQQYETGQALPVTGGQVMVK